MVLRAELFILFDSYLRAKPLPALWFQSTRFATLAPYPTGDCRVRCADRSLGCRGDQAPQSAQMGVQKAGSGGVSPSFAQGFCGPWKSEPTEANR